MPASPRRFRPLSLEPLEDRCQPALLTPGFGQLPLSFESNQGQLDAGVDFLSRGPGYSLALSGAGALLDLHRAGAPAAQLRMSFPGAESAPSPEGLAPLPGKTNYLTGGDPSTWLTDIPTFGKVCYHDLYHGIDLVYYGSRQELEFDFVVAAGADPRQISLAFQGADRLALDASGNLVLHTSAGDLIQQAPVLYQDVAGARHTVPGRFVLGPDNTVGFAIGAYDPRSPLIIDPVLSYVSYLGGDNSDEVTSVATDAAGNIFLAGRTQSSAFPLGNPVGNPGNAFVAKMDPTGSTLLYTAYVNSGSGWVKGIAVDAAGSAYVVGDADRASGFATAGAARSTYGGLGDAYVARLNPAGNGFVYVTYLGGSQLDEGNAITVDRLGNAFVTGFTTSPNFPAVNALQNTLHQGSGGDAFVTKINPTGTQFLFSTYLGGSQNGPGDGGATPSAGNAITLDAAGNPVVAGWTEAADFVTVNPFQPAKGYAQDAFVTRLAADGSQVLYSTFLGGPGKTVDSGDEEDIAYGVAVDRSGNIFVTGSTNSEHFPTRNAFQKRVNSTGIGDNRDAFITRLNPQAAGAAQLVYSTYNGGSAIDETFAIAVDSAGYAYVTGHANSTLNFHQVNPFQKNLPGGLFTKLSPAGAVLINSHFDGDGQGVAVDGFGNVIFVGHTYSNRLPTTADALQPTFPGMTDSGFVARLAGGNKLYVGDDQDGDHVTVRLTGPGAVNVVRDDPDGDGKGPIRAIYLQGTSPSRSVLTVSVTKGGDGLVDIGDIWGPGLSRITAPLADLVGGGIHLTGRLAALSIHDLKNGADVLAAGLATQGTSIVAHVVGAGTTIDVGGYLSLLRAAGVGAAVIHAPRISKLSVLGDFAAGVTLTGTGYALGTATITGAVTGASFAVLAGGVSSFKAGAFLGSSLFLGQGGVLTPEQRLASFTITGVTGSAAAAFAASNVSAARVGRVTIASVQAGNGGTRFGVHALASIVSVRVSSPTFAYNPKQPSPQGFGDFEVNLG